MMIQFYLQFSMQLITRYILKLFSFLKYFKMYKNSSNVPSKKYRLRCILTGPKN